jgi:hypothetical protein
LPSASSSRQHAAATGREAALFEPRHSASGLSSCLKWWQLFSTTSRSFSRRVMRRAGSSKRQHR